MTLFSMTGFGSAEGKVGGLDVSVEVRTVNHRFFNPNVKLPQTFSRWETEVRDMLRQRIARGHVTLTARIEQRNRASLAIDERRFGDYVDAIRDLQAKHSLEGSLDAATVLSLPGVVDSFGAEQETGSAQELLAIVEAAVAALRSMRADEGRRLAGFVVDRIAVIETAVSEIEARAPARLAEQSARLRKSVEELASGTGVDPQRLAQEVAILADKVDISEEIERFRAHIAVFRESLADSSPDPVGKRLGFLLQEMLREANTTGSKAADAAILANVVLIKEELERIREQVENIE